MRNMIRASFAIVVMAAIVPAHAIECSAEKYGLRLVHKVENNKSGTSASCSAGKEHGGSEAPAGFFSHEQGLCVAGQWMFVYAPETKTSTATYNGKAPPKKGTRVELKCTTSIQPRSPTP